MTFMRDRTYFDPQSGSIIDLPEKMLTKAGAPVELHPEDEHAEHRYGEKWNRPGEYTRYRERVEAQFSAPVPQNSDTQRAVSIVVSGFPASGKSTIGRIIARAMLQSGIKVKTQGQRATLGIADLNKDTAELERIRLSPSTEPVEVELWEIDRAAPHNH
jgi:Mrp family chromosome partitioning ATPase